MREGANIVKASRIAESRYCFIKHHLVAADDPDRSWWLRINN